MRWGENNFLKKDKKEEKWVKQTLGFRTSNYQKATLRIIKDTSSSDSYQCHELLFTIHKDLPTNQYNKGRQPIFRIGKTEQIGLKTK